MVRSRSLLALVLALLLGLSLLGVAGCAKKTEEPATTPTTQEPATPELKTVEAGKLIVGSDTAFPPFESMNGDVAEGFDVDLMGAIGKEMGLEVVFSSQKFDTLIPQLKAGGKFDIVASAMTINDKRKLEIDFADPYIDSNQSIAVLTDSGIADQAALAGKSVGVQSGTTGSDWATENLKDSKVVPFDDILAAFSALQAGKVDAIVNDLPVSAWIVKDPARKAKLISEIPTGEQYGFAVSKDNPDLLKAVNDALAKVKASGEYDTIYAKWFGAKP